MFAKLGALEPFGSIRQVPVFFLCGVAVIVLCVWLLTELLLERNYGLWLGLTSGFQAAAYLILARLRRVRAEAGQD